MKKITTLCIIACALINSSNSFGMFVKKTVFTKKLVRSTHAQDKHKENYLQELLDYKKLYYEHRGDYASYKEIRYDHADKLINILKKQRDFLDQNIEMVKKERTLMYTCPRCYWNEAKELREKLHRNLATENINKYLKKPNKIKSSEYKQ